MEGFLRDDAWSDTPVVNLEAPAGNRHVRRDRLISAMLQDRTALRVLSAPHGFGKTALAREYAERLFAEGEVQWVDASTPAFLQVLDGSAPSVAGHLGSSSKLVVIDGLPYLDEVRSEALSRAIDMLLYQGREVVVTTVPSCDFLRSMQPGRALIGACDLLVDEQECSATPALSGAEARARAAQEWGRAKKRLFGRVPSVFWGGGKVAQDAVLRSFFQESLPLDMLKCAFCMMLLGSGCLEDLELAGFPLRAETERMLLNDYPFFEFDGVRRTFKVAEFKLESLRSAVEAAGLSAPMLGGTRSIAHAALAVMFQRKETDRAMETFNCLCSDEECLSWLRGHGWDLLGQGNLTLVETLFSRTVALPDAETAVLKAMRAWECGLLGNWRESARYARRAVELAAHESGSDADEALLGAYLALVAFDSGGPSAVFGKPPQPGPDSPAEIAFLANAVGTCTELEVTRALCVDDAERSALLTARRTPAKPERAARLRALFSGASATLRDHLFYQLGLHILSFVDDHDLKPFVQDLGCDVIISMRKTGLCTMAQALVVRDLWLSGYFGPLGHSVDKRDIALLESASRMLKRLGSSAGYDKVFVPWEAATAVDGPAPSAYVKGASFRNQSQTPLLRVRLFGGFEAVVGERVIRDSRWRKKSRTLFCELVLQQGREVARDEILDVLWPGASRARALDNFYSLWNNLCSVVGSAPYLEKNGDFCRINPRFVLSDVQEFEQLSRSLLMEHGEPQVLLDIYARIEALYSGGLLPSEEEVPMIETYRTRYKSMYADSMVAATGKALEAGDPRLALWFARKGMEVERKREDMYFALIRAQVAAGQRCSAIRTYFKCKEFLRDELGLDPSFETQDLYDNLIAVDPSLLKLGPATFA